MLQPGQRSPCAGSFCPPVARERTPKRLPQRARRRGLLEKVNSDPRPQPPARLGADLPSRASASAIDSLFGPKSITPKNNKGRPSIADGRMRATADGMHDRARAWQGDCVPPWAHAALALAPHGSETLRHGAQPRKVRHRLTERREKASLSLRSEPLSPGPSTRSLFLLFFAHPPDRLETSVLNLSSSRRDASSAGNRRTCFNLPRTIPLDTASLAMSAPAFTRSITREERPLRATYFSPRDWSPPTTPWSKDVSRDRAPRRLRRPPGCSLHLVPHGHTRSPH